MWVEKSVLIPVLGFTRHGGTRVIVQIANYLSNNGWQVTIVGPNYFSNFYTVNDKVKVVTLGPFIKNKILRWCLFCIQLVFYKCDAKVVMATHFVTYWPSKLLSILSGKIIYYFLQDIEYSGFSGLLFAIAKPLFISTLRDPKEVIAANLYLYERLAKWLHPEFIFELGIDDNFVNKATDRPGRNFDVVYFLRHEGYKGLDLFTSIADVLYEKKLNVLLISQDIDLLNKYRELYGFQCASPLNDDELICLLDSCKTMLLTSSHEGFSLPPLECMARGVIPVTTDCGGPMLYCRNGFNSVVVNSQDPKLFVFEIEKLIADLALLKIFSENCLETAKSYRISRGLMLLENHLTQ